MIIIGVMAEAEAASSKSGQFRLLDNGKFECLPCKRQLASKQRVLHHLHKIHNMTPVKRMKKKYLDDNTLAVPVRTQNRWKKKQSARKTLIFLESSEPEKVTGFEGPLQLLDTKIFESQISTGTLSDSDIDDLKEDMTSGDFSVISVNNDHGSLDLLPSYQVLTNEHVDIPLSSPSSKRKFEECEITNRSSLDIGNNSSETNFERDQITHNLSDRQSAVSPGKMSDFDYDSSLLDVDDIEDKSCSFSSDESLSSDEDEDIDAISEVGINNMTVQESQALTILSCFLRNNLSISTCKDILETMKNMFSNSEAVTTLDFGHIISYVDTTPVQEVHYCVTCFQVFPDDKDVYRCSTENCEGLRYKGSLSSQQQNGRQPRQCFVFADIQKQLIDLLQTPGIWNDIQECKKSIHERKESNIITDITDGNAYHEMLCENGFLDINNYNLTAVFNTDGVNLYSSSKTELWPIFLAINELSPRMRFSRDNMLLVGIWQGKGKPPFNQYMTVFSEAMNNLYNNGVRIELSKNDVINVKLAVVCGISDLPAKAEMLNMTYYNGAEACISCEEPGVVVRQGKGNARCFPYRAVDARYPLRNHNDVIAHMQAGTKTKRMKGFKGISGLTILESYDIVKGTVPDYMHGALLGITKSLLNKWFSPSQSQERYFLGKHLNAISRRMQNIKPPDTIERLPRNLEKHYNHFKATELQAWLLYYAIPCLNGFLDEDYMINLMCFSEAVYILLGDRISGTSLQRADFLLNQFYSNFQDLYGDGACGLNVHNVGLHLVTYVKLWGPLWAWSCFPFEDANAMLLQAVHGTGIVLKQVMKYRQTQACIRRKGLNQSRSCAWKVTFEASNCAVSGALKSFKPGELQDEITLKVGGNNLKDLKKIDRITVNGTKFYSSQYSRMQKRICCIVMYNAGKIGSVKFFVLSTIDDKVYAVIEKMQRVIDTPLSKLLGGKHIIPVTKSEVIDFIDVENLVCTLVYVNTKSLQNEENEAFVVRMPNLHGHAIFK